MPAFFGDYFVHKEHLVDNGKEDLLNCWVNVLGRVYAMFYNDPDECSAEMPGVDSVGFNRAVERLHARLLDRKVVIDDRGNKREAVITFQMATEVCHVKTSRKLCVSRKPPRTTRSPHPVQELFASFALVARFSKTPTALENLKYVVRYSKIAKDWESLRKDLAEGGPASELAEREIAATVGTPEEPKVGRTRLAALKSSLCKPAGLEEDEWKKVQQKFVLPYLFEKRFGPGSAMLFHQSYGGLRNHIKSQSQDMFTYLVTAIDEVLGHELR
ncbi:hypothetical protein F5Y16DRAFT_404726 [Xylariaceae sp. FL0255]|nr:hypothetical protein F5Y16DRAFT_404726 [Xylariaceae sp. FL0255]